MCKFLYSATIVNKEVNEDEYSSSLSSSLVYSAPATFLCDSVTLIFATIIITIIIIIIIIIIIRTVLYYQCAISSGHS